MPRRYPVIVVGCGVAGMAAANLLASHGVEVLVLDENPYPGGQLLRQPSPANGRRKPFEPDPLKRRGLGLLKNFKTNQVKRLIGAQVLGIYPGPTLLVENPQGQVGEYPAGKLALATGARERFLPFKGWTLPGVISTGAAQILMKSSGVLPGHNIVIGGSTPLLLALASEIVASGGKVQAVLDQSLTAAKLKALKAGSVIGSKLIEAAVSLARLAVARVPLRQGVRIIEAQGRTYLERVVAGRMDGTGHIIQGSEQIYPSRTLAVGHGFVPNIELPRQAGCSVAHAEDKGGWHVKVSATMATSVDGIYAVGEITGIAGAGKSLLEGQIAAWNILLQTGRVNTKTVGTHVRPLIRQQRQHQRYGQFLNQLYQVPLQYYRHIPDEVTICRCEEISMGKIRRQLANGFDTMNAIKKATRCGMGNCQGRICGPILLDILIALTLKPPATLGSTSSRAPIKPVPLRALARMNLDNGKNHEQRNSF